MTTTQAAAPQPLWSGWKTLAIITMLFGFSVLIGLTAEAYRQAPPIPERVVDPAGKTLFTRDDVRAGQQVFLKYGLMANGTIWGHGPISGPISRRPISTIGWSRWPTTRRWRASSAPMPSSRPSSAPRSTAAWRGP